MIARDVVKAAALLAAKHAFPALPDGLVRWEDEPQCQGEGRHPQVTLSSVSHVPQGPMSIKRTPNEQGTLDQTMAQAWAWTVQVKCEGWKLDATDTTNPQLFTHKMRNGWYLQAVTAALLDLGSDEAERTPLAMVQEAGEIRTVNQTVGGHTLPVRVYELEFCYVERDADPTPVDVIESVVFGGDLGGQSETIEAGSGS